ncbi:DUF1641 domain-containing protein [Thermodesulfovibrionales bacterium]|nr:DUF1641 domain-containing protein [Thermodesulfovibrionales bacterium]
MAEKLMVSSTNGNEKMAMQIDEIYTKLNAIESFMADLTPAIEKISKDTMPTIGELREKYERDETLDLIKKVGDNIPTFVTMLGLMENAKGLLEDLTPTIEKISKDTMPTIGELRERYERDETLELIKKVGDNIPTFVAMLGLMENAKELLEDLAPTMEKILKDVNPTVNMLRESFEKDELLEVLQKTGENIDTFNKLLGFLSEFDKSGTLDFTLENMLKKEMDIMIKGMQSCVVKTMCDFIERPVKPGMGKIISAMRDRDVQRGILLMLSLAKNMSQCISAQCSLAHASDKKE